MITQAQPDIQILPELFSAYPNIQAVYLFGSTATGKLRADSDLDLAIVTRNKSIRSQKLEILADLARRGFCNVDLVFLDTNDIVLKFEAIRQNKLLYAADDFDRGSFYSEIVREYLDFVPYLKVHQTVYKQRVQDGQS